MKTELKHLVIVSEDALLVDRVETHQRSAKRISIQVSFREEFSVTQNAIRFINFFRRDKESESSFLTRIEAAKSVAERMMEQCKMVPARLYKTDNGRQFYVIKGFDKTEADGYFSTYGTNRTDYWEEYLIVKNGWDSHETYAWAVNEGRFIRFADRKPEATATTETTPEPTTNETVIDFTDTTDQLDAVIAEADSTTSPE